MSDLDDLARAHGGGPRPKPALPARPGATPPKPARPSSPPPPPIGTQPASAPPVRAHATPDAARPPQQKAKRPPPKAEVFIPLEPEVAAGVNPNVWVLLSVSLVVVLGLAFWLINRAPGTGNAPGPLAQSEAASTADGAEPNNVGAPRANVSPSASSPDGAAPTGSAGGPTTRVGAGVRPSPLVLEDIQEPAAAIDAYLVKRTEPDKVEVKVRNKSKRGVYVRALEIFAESDDRVPLDSIRFWLPPGGGVGTIRIIEDMPRRLGDDEGVTAVVQDAEFRDTEPKDLEEGAEESPPDEAANQPEPQDPEDPKLQD